MSTTPVWVWIILSIFIGLVTIYLIWSLIFYLNNKKHNELYYQPNSTHEKIGFLIKSTLASIDKKNIVSIKRTADTFSFKIITKSPINLTRRTALQIGYLDFKQESPTEYYFAYNIDTQLLISELKQAIA